MELTKIGAESIKREDYFGLVLTVTGHLYFTVYEDHVVVQLKSVDGIVLADQEYGLDVMSLLEQDEHFNVGSPELVTKLYSRNIPYLVKRGKSPFYIPEKDSLLARLADWAYRLTTKEK